LDPHEQVDVHIDPTNNHVVVSVRTNNTDDTYPAARVNINMGRTDGTHIPVQLDQPEVAPHSTNTISADSGDVIESVVFINVQ